MNGEAWCFGGLFIVVWLVMEPYRFWSGEVVMFTAEYL